jgi:hypothetical protein
MSPRGWKDRRPVRRPRGAVTTVSSRAEWRGLIELARRCAVDAREEVNDDAAGQRLLTLRRQTLGASSDVLERDAGAAVADCGRAFLRVCGAFARHGTPGETRAALAPVVDAAAAFIDDRLHAMAAADFHRAHDGRRPGGFE